MALRSGSGVGGGPGAPDITLSGIKLMGFGGIIRFLVGSRHQGGRHGRCGQEAIVSQEKTSAPSVWLKYRHAMSDSGFGVPSTNLSQASSCAESEI